MAMYKRAFTEKNLFALVHMVDNDSIDKMIDEFATYKDKKCRDKDFAAAVFCDVFSGEVWGVPGMTIADPHSPSFEAMGSLVLSDGKTAQFDYFDRDYIRCAIGMAIKYELKLD